MLIFAFNLMMARTKLPPLSAPGSLVDLAPIVTLDSNPLLSPKGTQDTGICSQLHMKVWCWAVFTKRAAL